MIKSFHIEGFRGIQDLTVHNLNTVNLIVGNNNSGKTSVLEALQLLSNPGELANIFRVARYRDAFLASNGVSLYESVLCMFPHAEDQLSLGVSAELNIGSISCRINGHQEHILIDPSEISQSHLRHTEMIDETEAEQFRGTIDYTYGRRSDSIPIKIHSYSRAFGLPIGKNKVIQMSYVSPCDHLRGNLVSQIIRNDGYKEICIKALQLFDPDITDILVLKSTVGNRPVDYIKHNRLGTMPLSTFGDGIKKVLVLANAIAQAANGVLLIDEIETAIHKKYYDNIFRFIIKACNAFHVQIFITTHSIETIDALLATQSYSEQDIFDDISVITLKKVNNKSYSRVLSGREVANDREAFGFEVRL